MGSEVNNTEQIPVPDDAKGNCEVNVKMSVLLKLFTINQSCGLKFFRLCRWGAKV